MVPLRIVRNIWVSEISLCKALVHACGRCNLFITVSHTEFVRSYAVFPDIFYHTGRSQNNCINRKEGGQPRQITKFCCEPSRTKLLIGGWIWQAILI